MFSFFFSCEKELEVFDCLDAKIEELDMIPYDGGIINCEFYLEQYEFLGDQYYSLGSHCADVEFNLTDCNGLTKCENSDSAWCENFFEHATNNGIVAISK